MNHDIAEQCIRNDDGMLQLWNDVITCRKLSREAFECRICIGYIQLA